MTETSPARLSCLAYRKQEPVQSIHIAAMAIYSDIAMSL